MSGLRARAEEYLAMRRALGFGLTTQGRHLMSFARFGEDRGATTVTTDLAVEWATTTASDHEAYQARRLDVVRISARHLQPWIAGRSLTWRGTRGKAVMSRRICAL
jgi:integrase/recombinase XerD